MAAIQGTTTTVVTVLQHKVGVITTAGTCKVTAKQFRDLWKLLCRNSGSTAPLGEEIIRNNSSLATAQEIVSLKRVTETLALAASSAALVDISAVAASDRLPAPVILLAARLLAGEAGSPISSAAFEAPAAAAIVEGDGDEEFRSGGGDESTDSPGHDDDEEDDAEEEGEEGGEAVSAPPPPWAASNGGNIPPGALREHLIGMEQWATSKIHLARKKPKPLADSTWGNVKAALLRFVVHGSATGWQSKGLFVCFEAPLVIAYIRYMLYDKRNSVAAAFHAANALSKVRFSSTIRTRCTNC
jgi:hypothetical protein